MLMRIRQNLNSCLLKQEGENVQNEGEMGSELRFVILERESALSLDFRPFGQSVLDGARSKVDLRGEGYAWAPIWWSSDNSKR